MKKSPPLSNYVDSLDGGIQDIPHVILALFAGLLLGDGFFEKLVNLGILHPRSVDMAWIC